MYFAQKTPRLAAAVPDKISDLAHKLIRRFVGSLSSSNVDRTSTLMRNMNTFGALQELDIRVAS